VVGTVSGLNMQQQTSDDRCSVQRIKQTELMNDDYYLQEL
jgi:hypothetical protein